MNKSQLKKNEGFRVKLRPPPQSRDGHIVDRDWVITSVEDDRVRLDEPVAGYSFPLGLDSIYSFATNPKLDTPAIRNGFLVLHAQIILDGNTVHVEPFLAPRAPNSESFVIQHRFSPLVVAHDGLERLFTWRGRDPVHLIESEEPARQLFTFATPLCRALLNESGMVPQFNLPNRVLGELVYEVSPDLRAKWRLLGGSGIGAGEQVLVLVPSR